MRILGIETSCDETAISIIEAKGGLKKPRFKVLSNTTISQIDIHAQYGGVFPMMAKREHSRNLIPILEKTLKESKLYSESNRKMISPTVEKELRKILAREPELLEQFITFISKIKKPKLDAIGVTEGPGLEPALWVGINFAQALNLVWNLPIIPINHMEGHIFASLLEIQEENKTGIKFPALALLISGGHTQLVLIKDWMKYEVIGETRDDAVGEAYDKVARMLSLPYPGGPAISKLAEIDRGINKESKFQLPRPMINTNDFDFSFSGLKTAVLYTVKKLPEITEIIKQQIAREFEDSVIEVLTTKTKRALEKHDIKSLILGGGVSANEQIRKSIKESAKAYQNVSVFIPHKDLSTDNALMISVATYLRISKTQKIKGKKNIKASGNLRLK